MTNERTPYFVTLPNRGLIHIEGKDRHDFLQGLITQDMNKLTSGAIVYGCLLTPQGKFLHDFFIHDGGDFILLDCEGGARAQDLYKRLNMYRLRSDVKISVEDNNTIYAILYPSPTSLTPTDEASLPSPTGRGRGPCEVWEGEGLKDPRHADMGTRSFEKPDNLDEKPFAEWDKHRIALTLPDGSRDMMIERSTLLECNLDKLNAIDFDKGCYMGQELTARMHYRGLSKKHLYTVHAAPPLLNPPPGGGRKEEEQSASSGGGELPLPFTTLENGGDMRSSCGSIGLALLKDDEAESLKNEEGQVILKY